MQGLPVLRQAAACPGSSSEDDSTVLALCHLGLDSVGPFKMALGGYKHILVAVDKFTKWIEVRAVTTVTSKEAAKFIEDITHRFGVPNRIVTDQGKAFTGSDFWDFCQDNLIDVYYSSVATHGATARSSEQTAWCFKPSKTTSSTTLHSTRPGGTQSCLTSFGVSEPRSSRSRDTRRSSWCTDQRRSSQPT
jgi:hypothetical protein